MSDAVDSCMHNDNIMEMPDTQTTAEINIHASDNESDTSDDSEMEPFYDYKVKIDQALKDIDMPDFDVEEIHHGYSFQNCVYALTSSKDEAEQNILRVPLCPTICESDVKCEAIENDGFLLEYLQGKLPVPKVKVISAITENALKTPFMVQTRLPGQPLDDLYADLKHEEKMVIVEQVVDLIAQLESIQFGTAGTFAASSADVKIFDGGNTEYLKLPSTSLDRQGPNLKAFLTSHIQSWVQEELKLEGSEEKSLTISSWKRMLAMLETLDQEGIFAQSPYPIVLHHWDLEPRNLLVEQGSAGAWRITGIIDWDDALAVPRPLARRPLDWIWDFDSEGFTGYMDTDHHPKLDLSDDKKELKARFDTLAAGKLDGYLEDAYGSGRWMRRIWRFAKGGVYSTWYLDLVELLFKDWEARPKPVVPEKWTA